MKYAASSAIKQLEASSQFCDGNVAMLISALSFCYGIRATRNVFWNSVFIIQFRLSGVRRREFHLNRLKIPSPQEMPSIYNGR
jgi:hypothetical protein